MNGPPKDRSWSVMTHRLSVWDRRLPPDLTGDNPRICAAANHGMFTCTRHRDHTGRHAAGDGDHIVAVWDDDEDLITRRHGGWFRR